MSTYVRQILQPQEELGASSNRIGGAAYQGSFRPEKPSREYRSRGGGGIDVKAIIACGCCDPERANACALSGISAGDSIWEPSLLQLRECWACRRQGIQWKALLVLCEAEPSGGTSSQGCKLCPPKKQVPSRAVGTPTLDIALDVEKTGSPRNIEICRSPGARRRAWRRSEDQDVEGRAASYQGGESGS